MTLSQLNANHIRSEDRLLLRISTSQDEEYRLWLTRLVTGELIADCSERLLQSLAPGLPPAVAAALSGFRQDAMQGTLQAGGFQPARRLPLGTEPQLVTSCAIERSGGQYTLKLLLPQGRELGLPLGEGQLRKLLLLLDRIQQQAGWGLAAAAAAPAAAPEAGSRTLH